MKVYLNAGRKPVDGSRQVVHATPFNFSKNNTRFFIRLADGAVIKRRVSRDVVDVGELERELGGGAGADPLNNILLMP
jgi:hypothetical protein